MARSRAAATAIVERFEEAHEGALFSGCGHPDDIYDKNLCWEQARNRLIKHLIDKEK